MINKHTIILGQRYDYYGDVRENYFHFQSITIMKSYFHVCIYLHLIVQQNFSEISRNSWMFRKKNFPVIFRNFLGNFLMRHYLTFMYGWITKKIRLDENRRVGLFCLVLNEKFFWRDAFYTYVTLLYIQYKAAARDPKCT